MKSLFIALVVAFAMGMLLGHCVCDASPYLVSDPPTDNADYYVITGIPGGENSPKDPTGQYGVKFDLAGIPAGTYSINVKACNALWGVCSSDVPFAFTKPSTLTGPGAVRLSK